MFWKRNYALQMVCASRFFIMNACTGNKQKTSQEETKNLQGKKSHISCLWLGCFSLKSDGIYKLQIVYAFSLKMQCERFFKYTSLPNPEVS
jgi:hypothetical protein